MGLIFPPFLNVKSVSFGMQINEFEMVYEAGGTSHDGPDDRDDGNYSTSFSLMSFFFLEKNSYLYVQYSVFSFLFFFGFFIYFIYFILSCFSIGE